MSPEWKKTGPHWGSSRSRGRRTPPTLIAPNPILGTCLRPWPPAWKQMLFVKGPVRKVSQAASGVVLSWSHILKAFHLQQTAPREKLLKQFNIKLWLRGSIVLCGGVLASQIYSLQFIVTKTLSWAGFSRTHYGAHITYAAWLLWLFGDIWQTRSPSRRWKWLKRHQTSSATPSDCIFVSHRQVQQRQKKWISSRNTISKTQICSSWNLSEVFPAKKQSAFHRQLRGRSCARFLSNNCFKEILSPSPTFCSACKESHCSID